MKYYSSQNKNNEIKDIEEWENKVFTPGTKKKKDWKEGRSAERLADFMLHRDGEKFIKEEVEELLKKEIDFYYAIPEFEVKFDEFSKGRFHDLGIYGKTESGESVFIGVEAKVDETFGNLVSEQYEEAEKAYEQNNNSKAKVRIEELLVCNSIDSAPKDCNLRYQLLYATTGTVAVEAEISILLIVVFKTKNYNKANNYDEEKGRENDNDFENFIEATKAKELYDNAYEMNVKYKDENKKLYILDCKI